ncbi:uncharacterized protein LOC113098256, partial [Tachysurus ichikawai]
MANHFVEFMRNMFINKHAEIAPPLQPDEECWYLPIFGVYHPLKPGKIRVVFNSSAQYEGILLNNVLLRGPDLNNKLLGVLMRFPVATFGLRRAAEFGEEEHGREAKHFVHRNFYVDDGLISVSSADEAISLLKNTKNMLAESNIKLHKISSDSHRVMEAFPPSERANDLKDLDLNVDPLPLQ